MVVPDALDPRHHTFLQALMTRGPLSRKAALAMFDGLVRPKSGDEFVPFLGAINKELEFVQMEVKKVMNQYDGKEFYGLINTLPSKEAKLGTRYSQAQIMFFSAVLEAIVQDSSGSGTVSSTAALNIRFEAQGEKQAQVPGAQVVAPLKMTMQVKDETLAILVADQLLHRTAEGRVGLGVKAFLELRTVFKNLGVPFCGVCNEPGIKAQSCTNVDCSVRMHTYCASRKFQARGQKPNCPGCGRPWPCSQGVGFGANGECTTPIPTQEHIESIAAQQPVPKSKGRMNRPRARRHAPVIDEDDAIDVDRVHDENATPNLSISRRSRSRLVTKVRSHPGADSSDDGLSSGGPQSCTLKRQRDRDVQNNDDDSDVSLKRTRTRTSMRTRRSATVVEDDEEDVQSTRQ